MAAKTARSSKKRNLGITGIESVDFVVQGLARAERFYQSQLDFALVAKSGHAYEEVVGERTRVFQAAKARIQVSSPLRADSAGGRFLKRHPDGVRAVTFRVSDLDHAWKTLEKRGANFVAETEGDPSFRSFRIASPLGDVEYRFLEKRGDIADPRLVPFIPTGRESTGQNRHEFTHIDHITSNTREMRSLTNWYADVLGFEHFWDIRFHTRDSKPDMAGGSGLQSIVMRDAESNIKFATNEPLRPNYWSSQISKYVEDNRGPGVQHIAFSTGSIMDVIPQMKDAGLRFLDTPDAYYAMLPQRLAERGVTNLKEDIEELRKRKILVDGKDKRYLLQIFMQEAALMWNDAGAGPFFYEVIQRHGDQGFGEGNFRALFESIERQQSGSTPAGTRTVQNPYLMD